MTLAWNGNRISRRLMLSYGLAGMAGVAGGIWPASALGDTNIMHGTKTGGRSKDYEKNQICFDDNIVGVSLRAG